MSIYLIDYENVSLAGLEGIESLNDKEKVFIFYGNSAGSISFEMHAKIAQTRAEVRYLKTERSGKNYLDFQLATLSGYLVATTDEREFIIVSKDTGFESVIDFWNQQTIANKQCSFVRKEKINGRLVNASAVEKSVRQMRTEPVKPVENVKPQERVKPTEQGKPVERAKQVEPSKPAERVKREAAPVVGTEKKDEPKKQRVAKPKLEERYKKEIRELVREECKSPKDYSMIYKIIMRTNSTETFYAQMLAAFKRDRGMRLYQSVLPVYNKFLTEKDK